MDILNIFFSDQRLSSLASIFVAGFLLNLVWENLHSYLYSHYKGGRITEKILINATLGDAFMLTGFAVPFIYLNGLRNLIWLVIPAGIAIAIAIELEALKTNRWAYNKNMPLIPIINVGFTPTIQLALIGYLTYAIFI